jgi:hypothetical protein
VAFDQLVDVGEVPCLDEGMPDRLVVADCGMGLRQSLLVGGRQRGDLAQPAHVRPWPAERDEIAVGIGAEVPQPQLQRSPLERAVEHVLREAVEVPAVTRRLGQHHALAHDPLPLATVHGLSLAIGA